MKYIRPFLFFLSLVFIVVRSNAQDVTYSEYDKFDFRNGEYSVVGMTGGNLYTYRNSTEGAMLDAYDDSMNKTATVVLDFFPSKIYETRFIAYGDKIIVLYQSLESNKVIQYAALLDSKGLLHGKPIELGSAKTGIFGAMKNYFYSAVSENKKSILIYTVNDKGSSLEFDGKWLDDNLTITKRSRASYKADNNVANGEVNIANDGTVYMAAYSTTGTRDYADQYRILTLAPGETKFVAHDMPLEEKYAASGYLKIDNANNHVYFGGFYANKKNGDFEGIIYASYDIASKTYQNVKFLPFDEQLANAAGSRYRKHVFDNYQVKQIIVKNDGGFVLVSEIHYVTTRSTYTPNFGYYSFYSPYSSSMVREFHYNDIMALAYNKDGQREWSSFVPKEQYSQEDGGLFSSYALLNTGGTIAFLYNDFNSRQSRIQLATLDADGKTQVHSFAAEGNDNPDWLPKSGKQVASRVLVVPCLHKKQICFAKVVF